MAFFRPLILVLLGLLLLLSWWRWQEQPGEVRRVRLLMGTTVEILAEHPDAERLEQAVAAAFAEIERLDHLLSSYRHDSEVGRLSAPVEFLPVSAETAEVLALGLQVAGASDGAFDLGLGRLKALWGLDGESPRVPSAEQIEAALAGTGPDALSLDQNLVRKRDPALAVDLGGIAKGYAVDRAAAVLTAHGISSAAINAGGDMFLLGERSGRRWRIGIQHPRQSGAVLATLAVQDQAVVTSGDYERFFEQDGRRYHHLFDPRTGYPAPGCQSVTVVADSVARADALATAAFVLGPQRGIEFLAREAAVEALIVAADGQRVETPGWAALEVGE